MLQTAAQRLWTHVQKHHSECRLLTATRVELEDVGDVVDVGDALCSDGKEIKKILLYGSSGSEISAAELRERESAAGRAKHGKLTPRLHHYLQAVDAANVGEVRVSFWLSSTSPASSKPGLGAEPAEASAYWNALRAARTGRLAAERQDLIETLQKLGARDVVAINGPPVVEATVRRADLEQLAFREDISGVDLSIDEGILSNGLRGASTPFVGRTSIGANHASYFFDADDDEVLEQYTQQGVHGTGIHVGAYQWSNSCGLWREDSTTPDGFSSWTGYETSVTPPARYGCDAPGVVDGDLCNTACYNSFGHCRGGYCMKDLLAWSASKLGSIRDGERRNASEMSFFHANQGSLAERLAWLAARGVTVADDAGDAPANDPNVNWSVRNDGITITRSVGWLTQTQCIDNAICVGSYDIGSYSTIDWWKVDPDNRSNEYVLPAWLSFLDDPTRFDAEKPDVVGNGGEGLMSAVVSPSSAVWLSMSGPELASPMVAGLVALLQQEKPQIKVWPEAIRAAVLASGLRHDVNGVSLSRNGPPDEADGAGVPIALTLREIVANDRIKGLTLHPADFDPSNRFLPGVSVALQPGETVRAVLAWDYCVEGGVNKLSADFNLELVEQGSGFIADWSNSLTNSLEMLQYTNESGAVRAFDLRLAHSGFSTCNGVSGEWAGLAWTTTVENVGPARLFHVTKTTDSMDFVCDVDCSLRDAILAANLFPGTDRVTVPIGSYQLSLSGTSEDGSMTGDLDILEGLEVIGSGRGQSVVVGDGFDRVFQILNGARVEMTDITIERGGGTSISGGGLAITDGALVLTDSEISSNVALDGGGIWNEGGAVVLRRSSVFGNTAARYGGGIYTNGGTVDLYDCELEGNWSQNSGGGLFNSVGSVRMRGTTVFNNDGSNKGGGIRNFDDLELENCTVSENYAQSEGAGLWNGSSGAMDIDHTTISRNRLQSGTGSALWTTSEFLLQGSLIDGDCVTFGRMTVGENNIESPGDTCGLYGHWNATGVADLKLGALAYYGGLTMTHAPRPLSVALDPVFPSGPGNPCPSADQRGEQRPLDADGDGSALCDSGSVERVVCDLSAWTTTRFGWLPVPSSVFRADTRYNTYRGLLSVLRSTGESGTPWYGDCVNHLDPILTDTEFVDTSVPPAGDGYFYLHSSGNQALGNESPLGWDSTGHERWPATPCPP